MAGVGEVFGEPPSGNAWIERANSRPIGCVEFRRVSMDINSGRVLEICTLRKANNELAQTIFCVMAPRPLRNINYVVTEHRGRLEPFDIQLYLPYVFGTLRHLPSERRREGHFGSDFSYDDLRSWLYQEGHHYEVVEMTDSIVRVRGTCVDRPHLVRQGNAPFDVLLDPDSAFVRGIDYRNGDGSSVVREFRAEEVKIIDGISIAGLMTMSDRSRNHMTTIRLEHAWCDRMIDSAVYDPSFRRYTCEYLASL